MYILKTSFYSPHMSYKRLFNHQFARDVVGNLDDEQYFLSQNKSINIEYYSQESLKIKTYIDRSSQFCVLTLRNLVKDYCNSNVSLLTISTFGCSESNCEYATQLQDKDKMKYARPLHFTHSLNNVPNAIASIELGWNNDCHHFVGYSDTSLFSLSYAKCILQNSNKALCICSYDTLSEFVLKFFRRKELLYKRKNNELLLSPFENVQRNPFWAESAAALLLKSNLEKMDSPIAKLCGIGISTKRNIEGAMRMALKNSNKKDSDISFIVSSINGSKMWDEIECIAIQKIFNTNTPVFCPKDYFGETNSAAPLLGIISAIAVKGRVLPKNIVTDEPNPGIKINYNYSEVPVGKDFFIVNAYSRLSQAVSVCVEIL